ncbi:hypothetical protein GCM10027059_05440 [Myceligenerans halotolerans]
MPSTNSLGEKIRAARTQRHMTQNDLAGRAGVSLDLISKLEQGQRNSARLDSLAKIAGALDTNAAELLGKPKGLMLGAENGEILGLRRAIIGIAGPGDEPPAPELLRNQLRDLWSLYWRGKYAVLARELPALIQAARQARRKVPAAGQREAHALLAETLQLTASLLTHLGVEDLAQLALSEALGSADLAEDELLLASMQATRAWLLTRQGFWSDAESIAATTAEQVEPRLSTASPDQLTVWGELLRYTALALTRAGRHDDAADAQQLLDAAAIRLRRDHSSRYTGIAFGPTVAAMRAVDAAVNADKPRHGLDLAQRVEHPDNIPKAMHARYLLTVAYAQMLDWRNTEAVNTLRKAETLTPELLPQQTIARVIIEELLPRRNTQRLPGLLALAERTKITA